MRDRLGREIEYLRISVTQSCNLKCMYCEPDSCKGNRGSCTALAPGEFESIVRVMVGVGIKKIRITGGEPLIRPDICDIIGSISGIPGIEDLSMTTNGMRLGSMAEQLKIAGLMRINVSLDSLREDRFSYITGGGKLSSVIKGIKKALEVHLTPVRINAVLIKGVNDDEIDDFFMIARDYPIDVRFIELMPIGRFGEKNSDKIIYNSQIIASHPGLMPLGEKGSTQPARYYTAEGYKGRVGFISPMSHKFCDSCNRIRLTCEGKLKPCLGNNGEADLTKVLRNNPDGLEELIRKIVFNKPEGHNFGKDFISDRNMSMIGG